MDVRDPGSSGRDVTDALIDEFAWVGRELTFSFPKLASQFTGYGDGEPFDNFEALNAGQQNTVRQILAQLETFTGLRFTEVADGQGVLRFGMTDDTETAHAYMPSPTTLGGDSWYRNSGGTFDAPLVGNYAWLTFLHEIGHALGLGHPHEAEPAMPAWRDAMPFTVMSYRSTPGGPEGYRNPDNGFAQTYMVEDIAALQFLYGANFQRNATDTAYRWDGRTGEIFINNVGQGAPAGNFVYSTLWDGGGTDALDFSAFSPIDATDGNGVSINLVPGEATTRKDAAPADTYKFYIANALLFQNDARSLIENAVGSSLNDDMFGNRLANTLMGGGGRDIIFGYGGDDILLGESGNDAIAGGDGDDFVLGGDGVDSLGGEDGNDYIEGGAGDDVLLGGGGGDRLYGQMGNDDIQGHGGQDTLDGGEGADSINGGTGDDVISGGAEHDRLDGHEGSDILVAGDGNDWLNGGLGADILTGGLGDDTYVIDDPADQVVELLGEGVDTIEAAYDIVAPDAIEHVTLTHWRAVRATGNAGENNLLGNDASNILDGRAGADLMYGWDGDDIVYVDNVDDRVYEQRGNGFDTVYSTVSYTLQETAPMPPGFMPYAGAALRRWDTSLNEIELLALLGATDLSATGNSHSNRLDGNSGNNGLNGMNGDDVLTGGLGSDTLDGGSGVDTASYSDNWGAVFIDLRTGQGYGNAAHGDRLVAIENVRGSVFDDTLIGDTGFNRLDGGDGDDVLMGNLGADVLSGDAGSDFASYEDNMGAVFVDLYRSAGYGNAAQGDSYVSIENLRGSIFNDWLFGDSGANRLEGIAGDDNLIGGLGADVLVGGDGSDTASYEENWGAVTADLLVGRGYGNAAEGDTYQSVENLRGGLFGDTLIGDHGANRLVGSGGNDILVGNGGADAFVFDSPLEATANVDLVLDFVSGTDRIELSANIVSGLGTGTLSATAFATGTAATTGAHRIIHDQASGSLYYDSDGAGPGGPTLFARLAPDTHLAAGDFVIGA